MPPLLVRGLCEALTGLQVSSTSAIGLKSIRQFSTTSAFLLRKVKRKVHNPYAIERARKRKEKNLQRHAELEAERAASLVDPVWGRMTPFLEKLDETPVTPPSLDRARYSEEGKKEAEATFTEEFQNFHLRKNVLDELLDYSRSISSPPTSKLDIETQRQLQEAHAHSVEAIRRIAALGNSSSSDRTRRSMQICIETFGRHNTDKSLSPDPCHAERFQHSLANKTPRAGPDTGSSEVQAAILTAKIRALAKHMEENKKDKHNKRNLRKLCHKRQKILRYLKRSDKGGVRYRNVMTALGLDDAAIERQLYM